MLAVESSRTAWPDNQPSVGHRLINNLGTCGLRKKPLCGCPRVQDVQYATLLSEMAYRAVECGDEASWKSAKQFIESEVGCSLPDVQRHKSGGQR